eukprot:1497082-Rhodomonas_salina.1
MVRPRKLTLREGPCFESGGRGDVTCAACNLPLDPDYSYKTSKCNHKMCETCAVEVLQQEDGESYSQADTQEDTVPEFCGGQQ